MGKAKKVTAPAGPSSRYRFFCWAVAFLASAQLVVGIDYITLWPGAEAQFVWSSQTESSGFSPLLKLMGSIPLDSDYWLFAYRLPGLLFYLLGLWLFYRWGRALFGQQAVEVSLLVAAATLLLPVLAKNASLDSWRFGWEIACWTALLRFIKAPERKWLVAVAVTGSIAALVGQWATVVMLLIWQVSYYRLLSPNNQALKRQLAKPFVLILAVFAFSLVLGLVFGGSVSHRDFLTFDFIKLGQWRFFFYSILGLAPFIGFTLAALRDLFYKLRRGEELAVLIGIGLIGSLLTLSLVFPFLLVFLTAKQLELYFKAKNYPWKNWVKTAQVLHLILVFIGVVLALLGGFFQFQADGFRAVLGCCAAYWMFSFVGVIGLYGVRRDYVLGGMTLAGLLALLFFWIQVYPFAHLQRNWPERMALELQQLEPVPQDIFVLESETESLPLAPYLLRKDLPVQVTDAILKDVVVVKMAQPADSLLQTRVEIEGWSGMWGRKKWIVE